MPSPSCPESSVREGSVWRVRTDYLPHHDKTSPCRPFSNGAILGRVCEQRADAHRAETDAFLWEEIMKVG